MQLFKYTGNSLRVYLQYTREKQIVRTQDHNSGMLQHLCVNSTGQVVSLEHHTIVPQNKKAGGGGREVPKE